MRFFLLFFIFTTSSLLSQISNVRQTVENGRVIITYDLRGGADDRYNVTVTITNDNGFSANPKAVLGDLVQVAPGAGRSIWWEPQYEGLTPTGWKVSLTAKKDFGITWILVEGGQKGDFYISATEVTFDQYDAFCEATGKERPSDQGWGRGKRPVINVNVVDALAFCNWLSKETGKTIRLPEEDEWEFAAKGGKKSNGYSYSGSNNVGDVAWYDGNSGNKTHEVAKKQPNELGIYDMSGNVWEWCGSSGVIRGGSWGSGVDYCRVSFRFDYDPDIRYSAYGFRLLQKK
jgi:hypothetical protein